ncbi:hypothetical protein GCM10023213_07710 [Prosthecobacter algae]|uniref:Uncharacterized protein n=1 Tax=Prosthecobacter algae TaxID=1144682 RepID=A0ABP9NVD8_9BACT
MKQTKGKQVLLRRSVGEGCLNQQDMDIGPGEDRVLNDLRGLKRKRFSTEPAALGEIAWQDALLQIQDEPRLPGDWSGPLNRRQ